MALCNRCSKACANRHWGRVRARQKRTPSAANYTDREIFERDGWRCHICGQKVRQDVGRTHPDGATIDHIRGGMPVATLCSRMRRVSDIRLISFIASVCSSAWHCGRKWLPRPKRHPPQQPTPDSSSNNSKSRIC